MYVCHFFVFLRCQWALQALACLHWLFVNKFKFKKICGERFFRLPPRSYGLVAFQELLTDCTDRLTLMFTVQHWSSANGDMEHFLILVEWPTAPIFGFDYDAYVYGFIFSSIFVCVSVVELNSFWQNIEIRNICQNFPSSKTAGFCQIADGREPAKIFSNQKSLSRTEQRHVSRITIKVIPTRCVVGRECVGTVFPHFFHRNLTWKCVFHSDFLCSAPNVA